MTTVRARANAKVTLSLRVLGVRDDGFHELEALTVSVGQPFDELVVTPRADPGIELVVEALDGVGVDDVPIDAGNLAVRAADTVRGEHGLTMLLRKRIPAGGGLGGGSADAAAALLAVPRALGAPVDDATLMSTAARIGSDVPFCVRGGAAWMRGRGERLDPVDVPLGLPLLVATPPFGVSTPAVYSAWDDLGGPRAAREIAAPPALRGVVDVLANDLESAAEVVEPRLAEFRARLEAATGRSALLAGSGASYVVPVEGEPAALPVLAAEASANLGGPVLASATVSRGVRLG